MLPKEVLDKIRRIQIKTSRMVNDVFAGQYHSVFKGRGMEFDEVREYQPGDEIRTIDWNVTARMGHPYIKKFVEERQLTVMLMIDASGSSYFGTQHKLKSEQAAELCSVLAFSAIKNNDQVGLIIFSDRIEQFIPPRKGLRHVLRVIREVLYHKPRGIGTDIAMALEYLNNVIRKKAICFLISDFLGCEFKQEIKITNKHHDLVAMTITDPAEENLPRAGIIKLQDNETKQEFYIDSSDKKVRAEFAQNSKEKREERERLLRQAGVDIVDIKTNVPYTEALYRFFRTRGKRLRT
ncbi:MAG: DUF58 domain-containing protein [Candidatus Omnitrophica bacterium]|nr:DUF58 domain-containing protein [Candidatus Omnitrophota bacterium]